MNKNEVAVLLIIFLVFFLAFSIFIIPYSEESKKEEKTELTSIPCEDIKENSIMAKVPAVTREGQGMLLDLEVVIMPGSGKVLTDIENLVFWLDTQQSIKTAKEVAETLSNVNTSNINIAYTLRAKGNTSAVGGSSAGAILALSTIAALENKPLNHSIAITGTINENGSIGKVGAIEEKIKAAKKNGASLFLLPKGQATQDVTVPVRKCENFDFTEICEVSYKKLKAIPLQEELNINIKEVSNVKEAMEYYKL